jgi:hypothetical protein
MNKQLLKALEPYSGAFLILVIWGEIPISEMNKYRQLIHRRITGKVKFSKLETEKIIKFLKKQNQLISDVLSCV